MSHNLIVKRMRKNRWQTTMSLSNSRCLITTVSRTKDELNSNSKIQKMMSKIVTTTMTKRKERKRAKRKKIQMMKTTNILHTIDFLAVSTLRHRATTASSTRPWRSNTDAKRLSKGVKMVCYKAVILPLISSSKVLINSDGSNTTNNKRCAYKSSTRLAFLPASTDMVWHPTIKSLTTSSVAITKEETLQPNYSSIKAVASLTSIHLITQAIDAIRVINKIAQFGTS